MRCEELWTLRTARSVIGEHQTLHDAFLLVCDGHHFSSATVSLNEGNLNESNNRDTLLRKRFQKAQTKIGVGMTLRGLTPQRVQCQAIRSSLSDTDRSLPLFPRPPGKNHENAGPNIPMRSRSSVSRCDSRRRQPYRLRAGELFPRFGADDRE